MAFHESFWVATSAVAPVIALATVVALPDMTLIGRAKTLLTRLQQPPPPDQDSQQARSPGQDAWHDFLVAAARSTWKWAWVGSLTTLANLIIQAALLAISLSALAFRQDIMPFWLAILLATGGIPLLAASALVSTEQRWTLERGLFKEEGLRDSYITAVDSADSGSEKGVHSRRSEI